jgi:hypothetical protein
LLRWGLQSHLELRDYKVGFGKKFTHLQITDSKIENITFIERKPSLMKSKKSTSGMRPTKKPCRRFRPVTEKGADPVLQE